MDPLDLPKKIAIVGTNCSALSLVWALEHTQHEVHIFESSDKIGGHTSYAKFQKFSRRIFVDTHVSLFNAKASPNLLAFLRETGVSIKRVETPFALTRDNGGFEWGSSSPFGIFTPHRNIFSLDMWTMFLDVLGFYYFAPDALRYRSGMPHHTTLREYLSRFKFTTTFAEYCLFPMLASLWNFCPETSPMDIPARSIIRLVRNNCLFDFLNCNPQWYTIPGGIMEIADVVLQNFPSRRIHYKSEVEMIVPRPSEGVNIYVNGRTEEFDYVVLAVHGDKAQDIWLSPSITDSRLEFLSGYKTRLTTAVLHSDTSYLPKSKHLRPACTYTSLSSSDSAEIPNFVASVTYNMNELQGISESLFGPVLVTINPYYPPQPHKTHGIFDYLQPVYSGTTLEAQRRQHFLETPPEMSYCGLWTSHGFCEDGVTSGLEVACRRLGAKIPFHLKYPWRDPIPELTRWDKVMRIILRTLHVLIRILRLWLYLFELVGVVGRTAKDE